MDSKPTPNNAGGAAPGSKDPLRLTPGMPGPAAPLRMRSPFPWNKVALLTSIPEPDSVAVITLDDTLWRLKLEGEEVRRIKLDDEYVEQVSGGELHPLPPPSPTQLAYLQTRRLVIYDLKWQLAKTWSLAGTLEEVASRGAWLSTEPPVLAVELEDTTNFLTEDRIDFRLRTWRLNGDKRAQVGMLELGSVVGAVKWDAGAGLVAVQRPGAPLELYGPDLAKPQPEHPLALALRKLAVDGLGVQSLRLHHALPVALVALGREEVPKREEGKPPPEEPGIWRVSWEGAPTVTTRVARYASGESVSLGALSPENDWVHYRVTDASGKNPHLYVQQVGAALKPPLALGAVPESGVALLWTGGATSLVMYDGTKDALVQWKLAGAAPAKPPASPKPDGK
ncbi:hypothetical protein [Comamonas sp. JC664]|uniref:hypothetical protein n=1 Tax=Comamonas sp. JC664 TaxID=2801917 RepID=UPI00174B0230|nr:hypothetical protein [Comamonas sp. JC664]MBL0695757.1 hypothetical protein [Comamonas sp. JC664]GHG63316.1 hypothetical protein GCM10012319_02800 [Comamonas sp. KCTC 72670]